VGDKTADELERLQPTLAGAIVLAAPPQTTFITQDRLQPAASEEPVAIGAPRFIRSAGPVPARELNALLQDAGAAVKLQPNQGQHGTIFVTGNRNTPDDAVPSIVLASEHYNMIVRLLEAGEDVKLRVAVKSRYHEEDTNGYNVLAEIPGTDPEVRDEVVLIGAHLDSWHSSPGGSDNADGVASTMEAMRILKALGVQPRRTIRMALWGGEEQGLLGARAWVQGNLAGDEGREAREKFYVYLNNDPGYGKILGWYMEGNEAAKTVFDAWLEPLEGDRRPTKRRGGDRQHRPRALHPGRRPGLQRHPGLPGLRRPDPPHQHGLPRAGGGGGPQAGRHRPGGLRLARSHAGGGDSAEPRSGLIGRAGEAR
jgi:carboxypeptidase Q